jgi:hypothetical protein
VRIIAAETPKVIQNSENNHHCARRNLIKNITDVIKAPRHATPGEMSRPVVAPLSSIHFLAAPDFDRLKMRVE